MTTDLFTHSAAILNSIVLQKILLDGQGQCILVIGINLILIKTKSSHILIFTFLLSQVKYNLIKRI